MTSIKTKKEEEKAANRNPFSKPISAGTWRLPHATSAVGDRTVWGARNIPSVAKSSATASKPKVRFMLERKDWGLGSPGPIR